MYSMSSDKLQTKIDHGFELLKQDFLEEAKKIFEKYSKHPSARYGLVRYYDLTGKQETANKLSEQLRKDFPDFIPNFTRHIYSLRDEGSITQALEEAIKLVKKTPTEKTLLCLARCQNAANQYREAIQTFEKIQKEYPRCKEAFLEAAIQREFIGQHQKALTDYKALLERYPNYKELCLRYAICLSKNKQNEEALIPLEQLVKEHGNYKQALLAYAQCLRRLDRTDEAEVAFKKVLEKFPNYEMARYSYAIFLAETETDDTQAIQLLGQLPTLKKQAHLGLGIIYLKQGKIREARNQAKIALDLDPKYASAWALLGHSYDCDKERKIGYNSKGVDFSAKSTECFKEARKLDPQRIIKPNYRDYDPMVDVIDIFEHSQNRPLTTAKAQLSSTPPQSHTLFAALSNTTGTANWEALRFKLDHQDEFDKIEHNYQKIVFKNPKLAESCKKYSAEIIECLQQNKFPEVKTLLNHLKFILASETAPEFKPGEKWGALPVTSAEPTPSSSSAIESSATISSKQEITPPISREEILEPPSVKEKIASPKKPNISEECFNYFSKLNQLLMQGKKISPDDFREEEEKLQQASNLFDKKQYQEALEILELLYSDISNKIEDMKIQQETDNLLDKATSILNQTIAAVNSQPKATHATDKTKENQKSELKKKHSSSDRKISKTLQTNQPSFFNKSSDHETPQPFFMKKEPRTISQTPAIVQTDSRFNWFLRSIEDCYRSIFPAKIADNNDQKALKFKKT